MNEEGEKLNLMVDAYINIREERSRITANFEAEDAALKDVLDKIKANLLAKCTELGVESVRTEHGLVMRTLKERFYTNDWENFNKFVVEKNLVDLLEKRIHQSNMKEYLKEHNGDGLPPGLVAMREYDIQVRRPNK